MATETLERLLDSLTVEGELYERLPYQAVRCYACGHRCLIREGSYHLTDAGQCPSCKAAIAGIWPQQAEVRTGRLDDLFYRGPRGMGAWLSRGRP